MNFDIWAYKYSNIESLDAIRLVYGFGAFMLAK